MFLVELNASSFLDLISKQARRNAAVSTLFENICYQYLNFVLRVTYCFFLRPADLPTINFLEYIVIVL